MNYILKPSLEHVTLVKIAATLWNLPDIRALMTEFCFSIHPNECQKKWQKVEKVVIEKVHKLPLPNHLKEKILGLIKPIGLQILQWIVYHCRNFLLVNLPNEFFWMSQGLMNNKKVIEILIKDEQIDITERYNLACIYCLEDVIPKLWHNIPENRRNFYNSEPDSIHVVQQELVAVWTAEITGETARRNSITERLDRRISLYQYAFESSANSGNKVAVEYFFQKLNSSEKEETMVKTAGSVAKKRDYYRNSTDFFSEHYSDILCFLFSHMNVEQQVEVFESHCYFVLKCLLDWPWQIFFLKTANQMWNFLPGNSYTQVLKVIVRKVMEGYNDFNYENIFEEFWRQSPCALRKRVTDDNIFIANLLYRFLQIKDEKSFKMIFQDATLVAKKELIFSKRGRYICDEMIYCEEWNLLKYFIQDCIPMKDEVVQFKAEFKEHIALRCSRNELPKNKENWDKFFHLLDEIICRE